MEVFRNTTQNFVDQQSTKAIQEEVNPELITNLFN